MSENDTTSPQQPDESPVDPVVLAAALTQIEARGGQARTMTVMGYPPLLLRDLCEKLADRRLTTGETLEWLTLECQERELPVPGQTAFYDFAKLVREEYRLARMLDRRKMAENYVAAQAAGDPDAQQLALNLRLTEILTDELMRAGDSGEIETDRLFALISGTKAVAAVAFDKQKMDARIKALEKMNQQREGAIKLLEQRWAEGERKFAAAATALQQKSAQGKRAITDADIAEVRKAVFG